jgi:hypothetical protein
LPEPVLRRAGEILKGLEEGETDASGKPARIKPKNPTPKKNPKNQLDLFAEREKSF